MRIKILLLLTMVFSGCTNVKNTNTSTVAVTEVKASMSAPQVNSWGLLSGKWYGSQPTKEGGTKQEIMQREESGTYRIIFRIKSKNGNVSQTEEYGEWGASGPIYFSIFKGYIKAGEAAVADISPYNYDAYKIISLNSDIFEYESVSTGNRYTVKRVPENFEFPN